MENHCIAQNLEICVVRYDLVHPDHAFFSGDALADVRCMTMQGDSWVNGCNADIQFTHTDCEGGVAKLKVKQAEKPRYSPYLARQNKQKNCTVTILSECVTEDIASGICTLELTNPYLE